MIEKNKKKQEAKQYRAWWDMNTGTRIHKDAKHKHRRDEKKELKKMLDKKDYE